MVSAPSNTKSRFWALASQCVSVTTCQQLEHLVRLQLSVSLAHHHCCIFVSVVSPCAASDWATYGTINLHMPNQ